MDSRQLEITNSDALATQRRGREVDHSALTEVISPWPQLDGLICAPACGLLGLVAGAGLGEAVGVCDLDDVAAVGEPVDDGPRTSAGR
jgi:hypothetical protein